MKAIKQIVFINIDGKLVFSITIVYEKLWVMI